MTSTSSTYFCNDTYFSPFYFRMDGFLTCKAFNPIEEKEEEEEDADIFQGKRGNSINSQCQRHHTTTTDWCCNFWILQNFNKEEETESWKKDENKSYKYDITYKGIFYVNHLLYCIVKLAKKGIRQLLVLSLDYGNLRFKSVI